MRLLRGVTAASVSVAVALALLTACTSPSPLPASTPGVFPTSSPSRLPTATPVASSPAVARPEPVLDLDCESALPATQRAQLGGDPLAMTAIPLVEFGAFGGPTSFAPQQLGGLSCAWANGEAPFVGSGQEGNPLQANPSFRGITLTVIPADTGRGTRGTVTDDPDTAGSCFDRSCTLQQLVGDQWVRLLIQGVPDDVAVTAAARSALPAIAASVAAAPRRAFGWSAPPIERPLNDTCEQFIPPDELAGVVGVDEDLHWNHPAGGWSLEAAVWEAVGALPCYAAYADRDGGPGAYVTWLPGGEWAWALAQPSGKELEVDGADDARLSCIGSDCAVDLLIDHSWVRTEGVSSFADEPAARSQAIALATRVAASLS